MYRSVPTMSPVWVRSSLSAALARPKSVTQTLPRPSSSRFDGFTSRCRTPWPCGIGQGVADLDADAGHAPPVLPAGARRRRRLRPGRAGGSTTSRRSRAAASASAGAVSKRPVRREWAAPAAEAVPRDRWRSPHASTGRRRPQLAQLGQHLVEPLALDELHDVVVQPVLLADAVDRHDVGVVQPRRRLRLALEPPQPLRLQAGRAPAAP